jgi:hypothetical protein
MGSAFFRLKVATTKATPAWELIRNLHPKTRETSVGVSPRRLLRALSVVLEQLPGIDAESRRNSRNVVDGHVAFRALHRAKVCTVDPAVVSQCFLRQFPRSAHPAHILGQNVPKRAFVRPFHGRRYRPLVLLRRPLLSYKIGEGVADGAFDSRFVDHAGPRVVIHDPCRCR